MNKTDVLAFFGGRVATAAALGISPQAVSKWPDVLTVRMQDRVLATCHRMRRKLPPSLDVRNG